MNRTNELKRFRSKWKDCTRCPLHDDRLNVVLYSLSDIIRYADDADDDGQPVYDKRHVTDGAVADVLFIGEAPGRSEDALGEPFVGPAGHLLHAWIDEIRAELPFTFAITNVVCCVPFDADGKLRRPTKSEAVACTERLNEFMRLVDPSLIVLIGTVAKSMTGKPVEKYAKSTGAAILDIIHPSHFNRGDTDDNRMKIKLRRNVLSLRHAIEMNVG